MADAQPANGSLRCTRILPVDPTDIGELVKKKSSASENDWLDDWSLRLKDSDSARNLELAAEALRHSSIPVAFPTETVYGLGADATRDEAVKGIFQAKQRPSDNPLIIHFSSLAQIRNILRGSTQTEQPSDPIPSIYHALIGKFWPGPLTILLPVPRPSPFSPSVTAGLATFGARVPRNPVALSLIHLSRRPIAAPSANASTRPSPTAAEHVLHDLDGRIHFIVDGGLCDVGVESTVVDGLVSPPVILRPGEVTIEQLRACPGWENVQVAYKDGNKLQSNEKPRAPGMKYKHYSPRAAVFLFQAGHIPVWSDIVAKYSAKTLGLISTKLWSGSLDKWFPLVTDHKRPETTSGTVHLIDTKTRSTHETIDLSSLLADMSPVPRAHSIQIDALHDGNLSTVWAIDIGPKPSQVARGLFSALRELDGKGVDLILVEGMEDRDGDIAEAVMNRLRKAAEQNVQSIV